MPYRADRCGMDHPSATAHRYAQRYLRAVSAVWRVARGAQQRAGSNSEKARTAVAQSRVCQEHGGGIMKKYTIEKSIPLPTHEPQHYPFELLDVGDSFLLPCPAAETASVAGT